MSHTKSPKLSMIAIIAPEQTADSTPVNIPCLPTQGGFNFNAAQCLCRCSWASKKWCLTGVPCLQNGCFKDVYLGSLGWKLMKASWLSWCFWRGVILSIFDESMLTADGGAVNELVKRMRTLTVSFVGFHGCFIARDLILCFRRLDLDGETSQLLEKITLISKISTTVSMCFSFPVPRAPSNPRTHRWLVESTMVLPKELPFFWWGIPQMNGFLFKTSVNFWSI